MVSEANRWTVRVLADDDEVAFGVIVRADGYILTKASRLDGSLQCELSDDRVLPAQYVGFQGEHDLALLKVDTDNLPVIRWQEANDPAVGSWAITPDAHGAPRAVGVVSVSRRKVPQVRIRGVLGVQLGAPNQPAKIVEVFPDSAAARAGLQPGDVITRVNQTTITSPGSLVHEIGQYTPGETLSLRVTRDGSHQTIQATLTHPFGRFLSRIAMQNQMGGELSRRRTGFPVVLQHDAVLKPEECGGALVDLSGAAFGINIARAGRTESYAIPDDIVRPVIDELLSGKRPPPHVKLAGSQVSSAGLKTNASGGE